MNFLTPFCPRRAAEGRGEHLKPFLSAKGGTEGHGELLTPFCPRRTRRAAEGRGEHLFLIREGPRRFE